MAELMPASRVTVRRAYEQLEKAGVIVKRPGKGGTLVNSEFSGNRAEINMIAVIAALKDQFASEFVAAVQKSCLERDIFAVLAVTPEDSAEQAAMAVKMAARGIKNMIVWRFDRGADSKIFERLRVLGTNMVFFDRVMPGLTRILQDWTIRTRWRRSFRMPSQKD